MSDNLRERLTTANLPTALPGHTWARSAGEAADVALAVFAEYLQSDATVERVARAMFDNGQRFCEWDQLPKTTRRNQCDRARAALAAAMAGEGEAS